MAVCCREWMQQGNGMSLACGQVGGAHVRSTAVGGGGEHWFLQTGKTQTQLTHQHCRHLIHLEKEHLKLNNIQKCFPIRTKHISMLYIDLILVFL